MYGVPDTNYHILRSMAPLYPPGLDGNGAVANLYPASWICSKKESKPGTIGITAMYNFCTRHQNSVLPGTNIYPGRQMQGTLFFPDSKFFKE